MNTRTISWFTAGAIWMMNPVFTGCEAPSHQDEFGFGEGEMLDLLDEMNEETWNIEMDGLTYEVTVDFQQRISQETAANISFIDISSAHACGSRSFFAEADACLDVTSLPIKGTVSILPLDSEENPLQNFPETFVVEGSMDVYGTTMNNADIWVQGEDFNAFWYGQESEDSLEVLLNSIDRS